MGAFCSVALSFILITLTSEKEPDAGPGTNSNENQLDELSLLVPTLKTNDLKLANDWRSSTQCPRQQLSPQPRELHTPRTGASRPARRSVIWAKLQQTTFLSCAAADFWRRTATATSVPPVRWLELANL